MELFQEGKGGGRLSLARVLRSFQVDAYIYFFFPFPIPYLRIKILTVLFIQGAYVTEGVIKWGPAK